MKPKIKPETVCEDFDLEAADTFIIQFKQREIKYKKKGLALSRLESDDIINSSACSASPESVSDRRVAPTCRVFFFKADLINELAIASQAQEFTLTVQLCQTAIIEAIRSSQAQTTETRCQGSAAERPLGQPAASHGQSVESVGERGLPSFD